MKLIRKLFDKGVILVDSLLGEIVKLYLKPRIGKLLGSGVNASDERKEKVIVSLTSYGRRVSSVLPYTIYSLLSQSFKPDKVILWLDKEHWTLENIPTSLLSFKSHGLSIRFCEDLRSYKKHVPALDTYPDDVVITVDDDFYYSSDFIERLMLEYAKDPTRIYTHRAHRPMFAADGNLLPYNYWKQLIDNTDESPVFATTGGGCLMKRNFLHRDATNCELFSKLCPLADDVWFYFMGILKKTQTTVLKHKLFTMIPLDNFYQLTHEKANLSSVNCKKSFNDVQIDNVMNYYGIKPSDLKLH